MSMTKRLHLCFLASLGAALIGASTTAPALAAQPTVQWSAPASAPVAETPQQPGVRAPKMPDLSALRYYARNNDLTRVAAEIRRLQEAYPTWTPPDTLYLDQPPALNEQPLWDLLAKQDFDGIDAMIARMKQTVPNWTPSDDFAAKSRRARQAKALVEKSNAGAFADVVASATAEPTLVTCEDPDTAWRVAEAFARTGDAQQALGVYRFVLTSCTGDALRLATAQKALQVLSDPQAADAIVALGHKLPDGTSEFAELRTDLFRRDLGEIASGKSTARVDRDRLHVFEATARTKRNAADCELLGWYHRAIGEPELALDWFRQSLDRSHALKPAEGMALVLRDLGRNDEAETIAYDWRDGGVEMRQLYIEIVSAALTAAKPSPDVKAAPSAKRDVATTVGNSRPQTPIPLSLDMARLVRFKTEVETAKSGLGAQSLGWALYNAGAADAASVWFEHSLTWGESEAAAVGLVLAMKKLNPRHATELIARYAPKYPKVAALDPSTRPQFASLLPSDTAPETLLASAPTPAPQPGPIRRRQNQMPDAKSSVSGIGDKWDGNAAEIARAYEDGHIDAVIQRTESMAASGHMNVGLETIRAWALFKMRRLDEAKSAFEHLKARGADKEAREGERQIYLVFNPRER